MLSALLSELPRGAPSPATRCLPTPALDMARRRHVPEPLPFRPAPPPLLRRRPRGPRAATHLTSLAPRPARHALLHGVCRVEPMPRLLPMGPCACQPEQGLAPAVPHHRLRTGGEAC